MAIYLSSRDSFAFDGVRTIVVHKQKEIEGVKFLHVEVDVPVAGQDFNLGNQAISTFYLANRFEPKNQDDIGLLTAFPIHVHVYASTDPAMSNFNHLHLSQLKNLAWATLYDNEDDAKHHRIYPPRPTPQ